MRSTVEQRTTPRLLTCIGVVTLASALSAQAPSIDFAFIPGADAQVGGPDYDFRVSRFEIQNEEFLAFLNSAIDNLDNQRGAYLFFDSDTGSVYIGGEAGSVGTSGSGTLIFDATVNDRIVYVGGTYELDAPASGEHPVTGVTWYGALKFCNWLTVESGLSPDERVYNEGPSATDWHPVTITLSEWSTRDLDAGERDAFLELTGYRLVMDAGVDEADLHNEWFKIAAARNSGGVVFDAAYGFGRDGVPTGADANFVDSGDPFDLIDPSTTPVGFFDGVNQLGDGTPTVGTDNGYQLYDLSGNVWEWMQDQSPSDPSTRRNRGGSWQSAPTTLAVALGSARDASSATATTGFRVVQSVPKPLLVTPHDGIDATGPWGGPYDTPGSDSRTYRVANLTNTAIAFYVATPQWIDVQPSSATASPGITLQPGETVEVTLTILVVCDGTLEVGVTAATARFFREDLGRVIAQRSLSVTVDEPIVIEASELSSELVFGDDSPSPRSETFDLSNDSATVVSFSVRWEETTDPLTNPPSGVAWLTLDGAPTSAGEIFEFDQESVKASIDTAVASTMDAGTYTADIIFTDDCTGEEVIRNATLTIREPFTVNPEDDVTSTGIFGGPFDPATHTFSLTNAVSQIVFWSVEVVYDSTADDCGLSPPIWLDALPASGDLDPGASADVIATINSSAEDLEACEHVLIVRFTDLTSGFTIDRQVTLDVTGLRVEPSDDAEFRGPLAGPFQPEEFTYTLHNVGLPELNWTATIAFDDSTTAQWVEASPTAGVILDLDGTGTTTLQLTADAFSLPPGTYGATLTFTPNNEPAGAATRSVTLIVGGESFEVAMVNISEDIVQVGGPDYFYRMGRYEVTNEQYARFLNDAWKNPTETRAAYLYLDTSTGSVYINDTASPEAGTSPPANPLLYNATVGRISFDNAFPDPFVIEAGFGNHPVVGVSWYGAVKFCNWITLVQGMVDDQRVYNEGATAGDWESVAFDPSDPASNRSGFRLPMDDGAAEESSLNEWYKVAARGPDDSQENPQFDSTFGFGRSVLETRDANFLSSGDEFDNNTTPIGHFDGINLLGDDSTPTRSNANGFGVFDLTGNVAEWMHERSGSNASDDGFIRGGHYNTPVDFPSLGNDVRVALAANATVSTVGFRIAQSLSPVALSVTQATDQVRAMGPVGGDFSPTTFLLSVENSGDYTLDGLGVSVSPSWLVVDGVAPTQVAANTTIDVPLRLDESVSSVELSPSPGSDFEFVRRRDLQTGGVDYDFWVSRKEITNTQFAAFLNDARANLTNDRGAFVYFDLDSSSAYINDAEEGVEGTTAPNATVSTLLYDGSMSRISVSGDAFVADSGYGSHPVVGVSWFGAVKYCNWLTLSSGMPAGVRAYTEGVLPGDWHPVSIDAATWATQDLTSPQRQQLVDGAIGFRLPMDDGVAGASAFSEWAKFASARTDDDGVPQFDATYGFGQMTLAGEHANYLDSGDTDENELTTTGFFNGTSLLADGETETAATQNRYELVDVTGNAAEWMQDHADGNAIRRAVRGGSFLDEVSSQHLRVTGRSSALASSTSGSIGFRVVGGTGHIATIILTDNIAGGSETRHIILDAFEPIVVAPPGPLRIAATYCDTLVGGEISYTMTSESASPMDWRVDVDAGWVSLEGPVAGELNGTLDEDILAITVDVTLDESVDLLPPGEHEATIRLINDTTGTFREREVIANVLQPIQVTPDPSNPALPHARRIGEAFETLQPVRYDLSLTQAAPTGCGLDYSVSSPESWITIEPVEPTEALTGELPEFPGVLTFDVRVNESANTLSVGDYEAVIAFSIADPGNPFTPVPIEKTVTLTVLDLVEVTPDDTPWAICCELDEETLSQHTRTFTLTNRAPNFPVSMTITTDVGWIDLEPTQFELQPGATTDVVAVLNLLAIQPHGKYEATIFLENLVTQYTHERPVVLEIRETLSITPTVGFDLAGRVRDADLPLLSPPLATYQLANTSDASDLDWRVTSDQPWILINDGASAAGALTSGDATSVMISVDAQVISGLDSGAQEQTFTGTVTFTDETDPVTLIEKTRTVSLRLIRPRFEMNEGSVSASIVQPNGPTYSFTMGRFAVTNAEFVAFLNDAMARVGDVRGEHTYFDTDTGDVYINTAQIGGSGSGDGGRVTKMFSPIVAGQIVFGGGGYQVVITPDDYSQHPVTGVNWYGAIKYCNWLTLDQGMTENQRCYTEDVASNLDGWHPTSITESTWASRDLNDPERRVLASTYLGYRLAMDNGYENDDPTDAANDYNEWFKAAGWNQVLGRTTTYAFGRDALTIADANFDASDDPFELLDPATTPGGFYDGTLKGGLTTRANENTFNLFDLTGNVHEWLQGRYSPPTSLNRRTIRGGSWADPVLAESLRTDLRQLFAAPGQLSDQIGFRVVRSAGFATGDGDGDGVTDIIDFDTLVTCQGGPGTIRPPGCEQFDFDGDIDIDLQDVAEFLLNYPSP